MKALTCGVLFVTDGKLLLGHVTHGSHWDPPKGMQDSGETPMQTAIRETFEETEILVTPAELIDLGRHPYNPKKDIHLFLCRGKQINLDECHCGSHFKMHGRFFPEIDQFGLFDIDEAIETKLSNAMRSVIEKLLPKIKG